MLNGYLKMRQMRIGPNNQESILLKSLSNESLIILPDIQISINEMNPIVISPESTSELKIKFLMPHAIRLAEEKNRKTLNLAFSLFDNKEN